MPTIGNVTIVGGFRRSVKKRKQQKNQKMRFSYVRSQNKACLRILQPFIIGLLATLLPTFLIACVLWDILLIFIWLTTSNGKSRCFIFTNSLAINRKHPLRFLCRPVHGGCSLWDNMWRYHGPQPTRMAVNNALSFCLLPTPLTTFLFCCRTTSTKLQYWIHSMSGRGCTCSNVQNLFVTCKTVSLWSTGRDFVGPFLS